MQKVKVYLPQKRALQLGIADWGTVEVDFQAVLDQLAESERMELRVLDDGTLEVREYSDGPSSRYKLVVVEHPTVEATVKSVLQTLSTNDEKRKELLAKLEEMLETPAKFLGSDGSRLWHHDEKAVEALCKNAGVESQSYQEALNAASVAAREVWRADWRQWFEAWTPGLLSEAKPPYHRNYRVAADGTLALYVAKEIAKDIGLPEVLQRIEVYEGLAQKAAEEQRERKQVSAQRWVRWAEVNGSHDIKLAIRDGYPLGQAVEREIEHALFPDPGSMAVEVLPHVLSHEDRRVPNQAARDLQAYLQDKIASVAAKVPEGTELEVGRIQAIRYWEICECMMDGDGGCERCSYEEGYEWKRTAVPVYLKAPHHDAERWYAIVE